LLTLNPEVVGSAVAATGVRAAIHPASRTTGKSHRFVFLIIFLLGVGGPCRRRVGRGASDTLAAGVRQLRPELWRALGLTLPSGGIPISDGPART
jgi:hypothetical protein